jgi:hypothetical protein
VTSESPFSFVKLDGFEESFVCCQLHIEVLWRLHIFTYRTDFLAGQYFDIRLEVHAPLNGSEANGGIPDPNFAFTMQKVGRSPQSGSSFFSVSEPPLEKWNFTVT